MAFINEPIRKTPVVEEVDVLVVGGGTAGLPAAVAAAARPNCLRVIFLPRVIVRSFR